MSNSAEESNNKQDRKSEIADLLSQLINEVRISNHHLARLSRASNTQLEILSNHGTQLSSITQAIQDQTVLQNQTPLEVIPSTTVATETTHRLSQQQIRDSVLTDRKPKIGDWVVITHRYKNQLGIVGEVFKISGAYVHLRTQLGETFKKEQDNVGVLADT